MDLLKGPPKTKKYALHRFPKYWISHGENEKKNLQQTQAILPVFDDMK
jgi:hypothetical protein